MITVPNVDFIKVAAKKFLYLLLTTSTEFKLGWIMSQKGKC